MKRIIDYDIVNKRVTYEYACHETGKIERARVSVYTFIGRMVQQIFPKGFQRVRYLELQATSSYRKSKEQIHSALNSKAGLIKDKEGKVLVKRAVRLSFREKILKLRKKDPLKCKKCGRVMELFRVWIEGVGTVFDWFKILTTAPPRIDFVKREKKDNVKEVQNTSVQLSFMF